MKRLPGAIYGQHRGDAGWVRKNRESEQAEVRAEREAAEQHAAFKRRGNDSEFELKYGLTKAEYRRSQGIYTLTDICGHLYDYPG